MKQIQFSTQEKIGIIICLFIILASIIIRSVLINSTLTLSPYDKRQIELIKKDIANVQQEIENKIKNGKEVNGKGIESIRRKLFLFSFDPNTIEDDSIRLIGLPAKVANNWIKYRNKNGVFYKPDDLAKVYGMDSFTFSLIKPYVKIRQKAHVPKSKSKTPYKNYPKIQKLKRTTIDINKADKESWKSINGIGEKLSDRIIKYRVALGGFYSIDQISEVYGLSDSTFHSIRKQLLLEDALVKRIDINSVPFKQLLKHPYVDYDMTKSIINYRNQHGKFKKKDELNLIYSMDKEQLNKVLPYLKIEMEKTDTTYIE